MSDRDDQLLAFLAVHPAVLAQHVEALLDISERDAYARLSALEATGLVRRDRWLPTEPESFRITHTGLAVIGSDVPPPRFGPDRRHDIGVAWVWLAARAGVYGPVEQVVCELEMRCRDRK